MEKIQPAGQRQGAYLNTPQRCTFASKYPALRLRQAGCTDFAFQSFDGRQVVKLRYVLLPGRNESWTY